MVNRLFLLAYTVVRFIRTLALFRFYWHFCLHSHMHTRPYSAVRHSTMDMWVSVCVCVRLCKRNRMHVPYLYLYTWSMQRVYSEAHTVWNFQGNVCLEIETKTIPSYILGYFSDCVLLLMPSAFRLYTKCTHVYTRARVCMCLLRCHGNSLCKIFIFLYK